jgi:hypothetical protein
MAGRWDKVPAVFWNGPSDPPGTIAWIFAVTRRFFLPTEVSATKNQKIQKINSTKTIYRKTPSLTQRSPMVRFAPAGLWSTLWPE